MLCDTIILVDDNDEVVMVLGESTDYAAEEKEATYSQYFKGPVVPMHLIKWLTGETVASDIFEF